MDGRPRRRKGLLECLACFDESVLFDFGDADLDDGVSLADVLE